jgi:hypothetical protein
VVSLAFLDDGSGTPPAGFSLASGAVATGLVYTVLRLTVGQAANV